MDQLEGQVMATHTLTCVGLAKTHLPGCLWDQGLLQVQGTPETEIQAARPYVDAPCCQCPRGSLVLDLSCSWVGPGMAQGETG